jgi:signal transduction histidine kinase
LFHPEDQATGRADALRMIGDKQCFHALVNRNVHKDGRTVWLMTSGVPILSETGDLLGYRGVDADITEAKEAEAEIKAKSQRLELVNRALGQERMKLLAATEQLKRASDEMKRLADAKSEFVASVSHDLRTPLTTIIEGVRLTEEGSLGPLNDEQKQYLRYAREDAERLSELIDNLLDATKIESGKMTVTPSRVDIARPILHLKASFDLYVQARGLKLNVELPPGSLYVWCDAGHYERVLANLVGNAVKYTPAGGQIVVRAAPGDGHMVVTEVADTGRGIPQAEQARIFGKFEQVRRAGDETMTGTGLGLAICKQLVEMNGGTIRFESDENRGTTFYFALPAYPEQSS